MRVLLLLFSIIILTPGNLWSWQIKREEIKTADNVVLVAKRYYNPGGIPVILQHGFALNFNCWDYPEKSFARFLANRGYDVWLTNLRSHGEGEFQSGPDRGPGNWDIDTFAVYDVPAIIDHVTRKTGKKPFWVAHSMGGTIMYIYLEGAMGIPVTGSTDGAVKVRLSKEASEIRNRQLRGFVAIASPAGLGFPVSLKGKGLRSMLKYNYYDYDLLLQMAGSRPWNSLSHFLGPVTANETLFDTFHIPAVLWANNLTGTLLLNILTPSILKYLGERFSGDMNAFVRFIQHKMGIEPIDFILNIFWNTGNVSRDGIYFILNHSLDNFSPRLVHQWYNWLRNGTFDEQCDTDPCEPVDYLPYLERITLPSLFVSGGADKLINPINVYRAYRYASSTDKHYLELSGFGHIDLIMGNRAEEVFGIVYRWLQKH